MSTKSTNDNYNHYSPVINSSQTYNLCSPTLWNPVNIQYTMKMHRVCLLC